MFIQANGLWHGFPFFLDDLRPQGFLGRLIATKISRLLWLPEDLRRWSNDDALVYLEAAGEDLPGNLVLGEQPLRRALAAMTDLPSDRVLREEDWESFYPAQAAEISKNLPASSAGGEQPKFLATLRTFGGEYRPVLVKFTAPLEQETGRRWADLLACELHAHELLAKAGLAVPGARLLDAGGRRFLEVTRFDRSGASGRKGVVSLEALAAASVGLARDWNSAALELHRCGLIHDDSLAAIQRLQAFGELIGNTDMHPGNLAFFLGDSLPLQVTPCYDMLPMLWAPGPQGEIVDRRFAPAPPVPALSGPWREAAALATDFWRRVAGDSRVSEAFRAMARDALDVVSRLQRHVD
jgi:hypothetical protein